MINIFSRIKGFRNLNNKDLAKALDISPVGISIYLRYPEKQTLGKIEKLINRFSFNKWEKLMLFADEDIFEILKETGAKQ